MPGLSELLPDVFKIEAEARRIGAREEQEALVRLISEDSRLQGWRLEPAVESYRRLLLDLVHAGEHRREE